MALDFALRSAAREVQTGAAQGVSSSGQFVATYLCPVLGQMLSCANIVVNVHPVTPDFYNGPQTILNGVAFCTGTPGQLMLAQAVYDGPSFVGGLRPAWANAGMGSLIHATLSSVGFVNEAYQVSAAPAAGC